jgi:hypothetical protein
VNKSVKRIVLLTAVLTLSAAVGNYNTIGENIMSEQSQPTAVQGRWCEPVKGLAGRLRIFLEDLNPGLRHAVYVELRNHSAHAMAVIDHPQVRAELLDVSGKALPVAGLTMSGPIPESQWGVIPRGAYLGLRIDMQIAGMPTREQGRALMALGGQAWELTPGIYNLKVVLTFPKEPEGPSNQWIGRLALPPVTVSFHLSALSDP